MPFFIKLHFSLKYVHTGLVYGRLYFTYEQSAIPYDNIEFYLIGPAKHITFIIKFSDINHFYVKGFFQNAFECVTKGLLGIDTPASTESANRTFMQFLDLRSLLSGIIFQNTA